jgi:hypothetical protein
VRKLRNPTCQKLTILIDALYHPDCRATAIVHWSWTGAGDKNPDGTARQRRYGMMTMVAEKRSGGWLVVASQNDNSFPGLPPEFEGITSPISIPDQIGPQPSNK